MTGSHTDEDEAGGEQQAHGNPHENITRKSFTPFVTSS
jgi:hypothetical protein